MKFLFFFACFLNAVVFTLCFPPYTFDPVTDMRVGILILALIVAGLLTLTAIACLAPEKRDDEENEP